MAESVYKIIEVVGTSPESWEKASLGSHETSCTPRLRLRAVETPSQQACDLANVRLECARFRPWDEKAVQEASQ